MVSFDIQRIKNAVKQAYTKTSINLSDLDQIVDNIVVELENFHDEQDVV